jgi:uncharacterized protein (DUF362 family)
VLKLSRRGLLRSATGLALGYWAGCLFQEDCYPVYADELEAPAVVVAEGTNDDSAEVLLRTALAPLGGIERFVKPGQTVAIKPNVTWDRPPHTASSQDPDLMRAMINMVRAAGASRILIVDRSVFDPPALVLEVTELGPVFEETGVEVHVLDRFVEPKSKYMDIDIPDGKAFQRIGVVKVAAEADVRINMAVAKSHIVLPVTLCCKHMMGYLENPPGLHVSLDQGIADILSAPAIHSELHILEAIRVRVRGAAYGDGTDITDPDRVKRKNQVIAGVDPVLIDAYATATFFNRSPMEITHIKRCFEAGLGEIDLQKASATGRLQSFRPADIKPTPTPSPTSTPTLVPAVAIDPTEARPTAQIPAPTATPVPTRTPVPRSRRRIVGDEILDLNPLLDAPLVPLAAIVGGTGVVVGRRLAGKLKRQAEEGQAAGDARADAGPGTNRPERGKDVQSSQTAAGQAGSGDDR